jgi:hypothetical protein
LMLGCYNGVGKACLLWCTHSRLLFYDVQILCKN